jgi:hypothetical protein
MVKKKGMHVWSGPPAAPDRAKITRDVSCQGVLGMTLQNALQSLQTNNTIATQLEGDNCDNRNDASSADTAKNRCAGSIFTDQQSIDRIMKSFAEAIANSYETMSSTTNATNTNTQSDEKGRTPIAPSAVLCGKVDHYNRRSDKWRILVRNSKIVERKHCSASHFTTRVRHKPMFWNVATAAAASDSLKDEETKKSSTRTYTKEKQTSSHSNNILSLSGDLELLAYNDR